VVQALHGGALSDPALSAGSCDTQFGTGGGESLCSFRESLGANCSTSDRRGVQHQQLAAEAFDPMPSLRTGVVKLATAVRAHRKRKGADNNDEHHRDQHDRSQQDCGHRFDGTPEATAAGGLSRATRPSWAGPTSSGSTSPASRATPRGREFSWCTNSSSRSAESRGPIAPKLGDRTAYPQQILCESPVIVGLPPRQPGYARRVVVHEE
jgi:hypothetical protein